MRLVPLTLLPHFHKRPWGRTDLSPWYEAKPVEPIGEAWLTGKDCIITGGPFDGQTLADVVASHGDELLGASVAENEFPLLIKFLFPNEKLSVQVHPNDEQAACLNSKGKTECWYIMDAKPGAAVAVGFEGEVTNEQVREAVAAKTLESLLHLEPVTDGDMVFVDANTVHAIWPGVTVLETQQTCDITYRMYDYGRPRELHLDQGLAVMKTQTRAGKVPPHPIEGGVRLIEEKYFTVDRFEIAESTTQTFGNSANQPHCLMLVQGRAVVTGDFEPVELMKGQAVIIPASLKEWSILATENASVVRSTV